MRIPQYALKLFQFVCVGLCSRTVGTTSTPLGARFGRSESRIVYGVNVTPINKYPMIVALLDDDGFVGCAGTILDKYHVLTATFCVSNPKRPFNFVLAGIYSAKGINDSYVQKVSVKNAIRHARYRHKVGEHRTNDIAVLRLRTPLLWNDRVTPTNLPIPGWTVLPNVNMKGILAGWGVGKDQKYPYRKTRPLQEVELPLMTTESCQRKVNPSRVSDNEVCVRGDGGAAGCLEDEGGPLFIYNEADDKHIQIGVQSWFPNGCGDETDGDGGFPSIATKVSKYISWIQETTRECNPQRPI